MKKGSFFGSEAHLAPRVLRHRRLVEHVAPDVDPGDRYPIVPCGLRRHRLELTGVVLALVGLDGAQHELTLPEDVNRAQVWIASTSRHPTSMV